MLKLGIVYKNGVVINHRSLLKVIINPFLRYIGFCIGTLYSNDKLKRPVLTTCQRQYKNPFYYSYDTDYDRIEKKRMFI